MRKIWLTGLLLLQCTVMFPIAYTTITGKISGADSYKARLLVWTDQITFSEKLLASAPISSEGSFNLIAELREPTFAFIAIGNLRTGIILEPGKGYDLQFGNYPAESYLETRNLFLQNESLNYRIVNQIPDDLNLVANEINTTYNKFLAQHYMDVYKKRQPVIDSFIDNFFLLYGGYTQPYVRIMVDYKIAMLKLGSYKVSMEQAYNLWLSDQDFLYTHPDFMEFFNQLFSQYLTTRLKNYSFQELKNTINDQGSYFGLSELIGRDTVLRNELLREVVMIKGLGEIYNHRDFSKPQVLKILNHIALFSKFEEHRAIAQNLITLFTRFDHGRKAPEFSFSDKQGATKTLNDFSGKYLYLVFYTSNCVPCLSELEMLKTYYNDIKSGAEVVTVSLDPNQGKFWKSSVQQQYPWPVLHFNHQFDQTDQYGIRSYPVFILIAPDGTFEAYNARQPSSQFREWFEEVVLKPR